MNDATNSLYNYRIYPQMRTQLSRKRNASRINNTFDKHGILFHIARINQHGKICKLCIARGFIHVSPRLLEGAAFWSRLKSLDDMFLFTLIYKYENTYSDFTPIKYFLLNDDLPTRIRVTLALNGQGSALSYWPRITAKNKERCDLSPSPSPLK